MVIFNSFHHHSKLISTYLMYRNLKKRNIESLVSEFISKLNLWIYFCYYQGLVILMILEGVENFCRVARGWLKHLYIMLRGSENFLCIPFWGVEKLSFFIGRKSRVFVVLQEGGWNSPLRGWSFSNLQQRSGWTFIGINENVTPSQELSKVVDPLSRIGQLSVRGWSRCEGQALRGLTY